jgi:hypothetical protein
MEVMLDPAYASGSLLRAEDALTAVVIRNVHRAAGHTAELLRERPDPDHEYDEETEPVYYVVTSQSAAPSTAFQE